jgi:Toastrack DUF4097
MTQSRRNVYKCLMALAATCLAFSTTSLAAEGRFQRTLHVAGPVDLSIHTGSGTITVRTGGNSTVEIRGTIQTWGGFFSKGEVEKKVSYIESHPPIEQRGNTVKIGTSIEAVMQHNVSISYDLVVPEHTRLSSNTGSGRVMVDGIFGPLDASAGSGDIRASNIGGSIQASTGSGQIMLEMVKEGVRASTGSGDIRVNGAAGNVRASTGSGNVTIVQTGSGDARVSTASGKIFLRSIRGLVHAKTVSGSITAEGGGQAPWYLESVSGSVSVRVPPNLGFNLCVHTVSGGIYTSQPLTLQGTVNKRKITGKAGKGGFLLDVGTVSGNIHIDWMA